MNIFRKSVPITEDRTLGVELAMRGRSLLITGAVPPGLEVAFDTPAATRVPIWQPTTHNSLKGFDRIFVFHPAASFSGTLEFLTADEPGAFGVAPPASTAPVAARLVTPDGVAMSIGTAGDGNASTNRLLVSTALEMRASNGALVSMRTPDVLIYAALTSSGGNVVYTPAAGKKFRLLRYRLAMPQSTTQAVSGVSTIQLEDGAGVMPLKHALWIPSAVIANPFGAFDTGWIDLGNGYLSAAAGNSLIVRLPQNLNANSAIEFSGEACVE